MNSVVIDKAESIVRKVAKKYLSSIDGFEYDDLMQIGRIVCWQIISEKNIDETNFDNYGGYLYKSLINTYSNEFKKTKAQKRIRLSETVSLDSQIGFDDERSLYEVIPARESEISVETLELIKGMAYETRDPKAIKGVVICLAEMLGLLPQDTPREISYKTFVDYGLQYYLWIFFNNSPYQALRYAFPELSPEDMKKVPNSHWSGEKGKRRALKLLRKSLSESNYPESDYPLVVNEKYICNIGLSTPYQKHFHSRPFDYLNAAFPRKFKPWEMAVTPKGYIRKTPAKVRKIVFWLVEEKLQIPLSDMDEKEIWRQRISKRLTKEAFESNGLRGLLDKFNNSPEAIIRFVYPDKFKPWDFPNKQKWKGSKGMELAAEATRWVIEDYAGLSPLSPAVGYKFFIENGLHGMITSRTLGFNSSPKAALSNAYPDLFL